MYIIEKIIKFFYDLKTPKNKYTAQEIEKCNHMFFPIDSSGEYLACSKCGKLIKKSELEKFN